MGNITQTSPLMNIGAVVEETVPGTFTQEEITLPLNPLDREVFVVTDIEIRCQNPELITATISDVVGQVTKTTQGAIIGFHEFNCMAQSIKQIQALGATLGVVYVPPDTNPRTSTGKLTEDYLDILATPNFFIGVEASNNIAVKHIAVKITGYRAKATSDIYTALIVAESQGV